MALFKVFLASTLMGFAVVSWSQPTVDHISPEGAARIDRVVRAAMEKDEVPGMEVAVLQGGRVTYECGYGLADVRLGLRPDPDTAFEIDSITKPFTAMAVLRLVEERKMQLDDPIAKYIEVPNENWKPVTIRQLLTMTGGIPTSSVISGSYKRAVERAAKENMVYEPGTHFFYSNPGYMLLGEAVASVSGEDYFAAEKALILQPFGLSHTGFFDLWTTSDHATPYEKGQEVKARAPISGYSAGGLVSTMRDLELFASELYQKQVLSSAAYDLMWTRATTSTGEKIPFGMGWELRTAEENHYSNVVAKDGGGFGWKAQFNYYIDKGITVIMLANAEVKDIPDMCKAAARAVEHT